MPEWKHGAKALTDETNQLRTDTQGVVSCEHRRNDICHRCMDLLTGFKSGVMLNDTLRGVYFKGMVNRGRDVAPNIEPRTYCDCGDPGSHNS